MKNNSATSTSTSHSSNHPSLQSFHRNCVVDQILREKALCSLLSIGKSKLRTMIRDGHFPRPIVLGPPGSRAVGWKSSDVCRWLDEREESKEVA